ncbi:MAG: ribokinase [Actinobacteria bacterium]|nr:ribokinase [Cyanobacteriota bacterium]MCL5771665.1 ribokinase [Actinomycetota bacterium]
MVKDHNKKRVVVIGSINVDYILKVVRFPVKGETLIANSYEIRTGGKGANQAKAISKLGIPVSLVGKIGEDIYTETLMQSFKKANINTKGIIIDKLEKTGAAFITVDIHGNNTIIISPGANYELTKKDIELNKELILDCDIVVLQLEIPKEVVEYVINFSKNVSKLIVLNLSPFMKIEKSLLKRVDFLIVNEIEIKQLSGSAFDNFDKNQIEIILRKIRKFYKNNIIITLGEKGAVGINSNDEIFILPTYPVDKLDSTGAGDAFIGGFILGLISEKSMKECINLGNAVGSISITKLGAQESLPTKKELSQFLKSYD